MSKTRKILIVAVLAAILSAIFAISAFAETGTLYGEVTYSLDGTTLTIEFPDSTTALPKLSAGTGTVPSSDSAKIAMLNNAETVVIKGKGLVGTTGDSLFAGFRNMRTLVIPSSIVRLGGRYTFNNCHNLMTVATYTSEDEIADIVANPEKGLIDLSYITSVAYGAHFQNAFRPKFSQSGTTNASTVVPDADIPATLTFKFGNLSTATKGNFATAAAYVFDGFSNATQPGFVTSTNVVISVLEGTDFATDAQTFVNGLTGTLGAVTPNSVTVVPYTKGAEVITVDLYEGITCSYLDTDPTTLTIIVPAETTSLPRLSNKVAADLALMLNNAKTVILKGSDLTAIASQAFYGFRNMETLVMSDAVTKLSSSQTFMGCANLKTVAVYASEDEIADIVANPTVGLIDLSCITSVGGSEQFMNAFRWSYVDNSATTPIAATAAPATLTIKLGVISTATTASRVFTSFSNATGYGTTPLVIEVAYGTDFAADAQTFVNGLTGGKIGNVTPSSVTVRTFGDPPAPELIEDTLYGEVTYSYMSNDPTTITITFPDATTSLVQFYVKVKTDATKVNMLNAATTIIIKGKGLTNIAESAVFYGFRNMETLVWPSTITAINSSGSLSACANLKTVAPYASEDEIDAIVANPTVGLIDLSNIITIKSVDHFKNAFAWTYTDANVTTTTAPSTLTIKFGNVTTGTPADIFANFGRTDGKGYGTTPLVIEVAYGDFATATQTYVNGLTGGKIGYVTPSSINVSVYGEPAAPVEITGTLYTDGENGDVSYSYWDNDPTTLTITFPEGTTALPKFSAVVTDSAKKAMLNAAKTVILKGEGLVETGDSTFYGFRNMETLVWPSTITRIAKASLFGACANLKTVAPYDSVDEIADIVANPTVGLIDLSPITNIEFGSHFGNAFRWSFTQSGSGTEVYQTAAPETLTIKFGNVSGSTPATIFSGFSNAQGYVTTTPVVIEVAYGDFATATQEYVNGLTDGKLGNVTPASVTVRVYGEPQFIFDDSLSATQISVRYEGKKNGLRYEFKFDKNAQAYMEENGYELVEYGIIYASAANKANATLSKDGNGEYVTSSAKIKKTAIVQGDDWAKGAKVVSNTATETVFAGTMVNWTEAIYETEAYIGAYSIYRNVETGEETISYVSYGDEEGQSAEYATSSLSKMMNFFIANDVFAGETVSEAAVWNALLMGAETLGESKVLAVDANTVAILVDGVVVVRTLDGTAVADTAAAKAAVEALGKTVTKAVALTVA